MFVALIAAFANSVEVISDKIIMRSRGVSYKNFLALTMFFIFILTLILFIPFGKINVAGLSPMYVAAFVGIIVCGLFYNLLYFYSLYSEEVCSVEPIALLVPLFTVLAAAVFFPSERSFWPLVFATIASTALIVSRFEKHHLKVDKYTVAMLGFVILAVIESLLIKVALNIFSPIALYCLRVGAITTLLIFIYRPSFRTVKQNQALSMMFVAVVTTTEYVSRFWAISAIGLVRSSLIMLLAPVLILIFSKFLLKENITLKKAIADSIIIICLALSIVIK